MLAETRNSTGTRWLAHLASLPLKMMRKGLSRIRLDSLVIRRSQLPLNLSSSRRTVSLSPREDPNSKSRSMSATKETSQSWEVMLKRRERVLLRLRLL